MDNDITQIETELRTLRLTPTSERLTSRLEAVLCSDGETQNPLRRRRFTSATTWTSWKWANWTVAAALIMLMGTATLYQRTTGDSRNTESVSVATGSPAEMLKPVRASRVLVSSRSEGILELPDGSPMERVREYYMDTIEWRDAAGHSQLRWEVPGEAVRLVGLSSY